MLTCRDAYALIVRTIDDDRLPAEAGASLRAHLSACAACREEYETQHEVRRVLALHIEEQPPAGFDVRLNARLANAGTAAPPRWRWGVWLVRVAAPIAATLLLIVGDNHLRTRDVARPAEVAAMPAPPRHERAVRVRYRQAPQLPAELLLPSPPPADALNLTDAQRKQIDEINDQRRQALTDILERTRKRVALERHQTDAAIERVLTPAQRRQYREQAADRERRASDGWTILPRASTSIPLPSTPPTSPTPLPQPPF
jgi:hypothetical protein